VIKNIAHPRRKKHKVVSIDQSPEEAADKPRLIASDPLTHRMIISIGSERIAFDRTTRITRLGSTVGDQPAPVVRIKGSPVKKRRPGMRIAPSDR
jgi:hypothetical protein